MPDIFDEVEEDLRAERARTLGRRYAGWGVACVILILASTGGYVYWQQNRTQAANSVANRFLDAARQADHAITGTGTPDPANAGPAQKTFSDIAANGPAGYRVLARLRLAALQWQTGEHAAAIASWQSVTDDGSAPRLLRDLALVTSAEHQVDSADPVLLKQRLETLTTADNRWRPMAEQIIALLDIRMGHAKEAAAVLRSLSNEAGLPGDMRGMAADLLATLPEDVQAPAASPDRTPTQAAPASAAHG